MNVDDMLKYLPDVLVRKRYIGESNAPIVIRAIGINAGTCSFMIADGN